MHPAVERFVESGQRLLRPHALADVDDRPNETHSALLVGRLHEHRAARSRDPTLHMILAANRAVANVELAGTAGIERVLDSFVSLLSVIRMEAGQEDRIIDGGIATKAEQLLASLVPAKL